MNKYLFYVCTCAMALLISGPAALSEQNTSAQMGRLEKGKPSSPPVQQLKRFTERELTFEVNRGQAAIEAKFIAQGQGYSLALMPDEAAIVLGPALFTHPSIASGRGGARAVGTDEKRMTVLRMKLIGAKAASRMVGLEEQMGRVNYFVGKHPSEWRTDIAAYARVKVESVYPGVDVVYYGNQRQLEFDFVVAPGADPGCINLEFAGADKMELGNDGSLILQTAAGEFRQHRPVMYQNINGVRKEVAGGYVLKKSEQVEFQVAKYDRSKPLIIDPTLTYATYLGGSDFEIGTSVAVDPMGNVYVVGTTKSFDFPTVNPFRSTLSGQFNAFVAKFSPGGSLLYSTYLGGVNGVGIAADSDGNAYITGYAAGDIPTTPGSLKPSSDTPDAFVAKLDATGSTLLYSTYLGGDHGGTSDIGIAIAVDLNGNAYVCGGTTSTDFPTSVGAPQPFYAGHGGNGGGPVGDAFVAKLNAAGSALLYATYLGGSGTDFAEGIAVDAEGSAYVTGVTGSTDFPITSNAYQRTFGGGSRDFFVAKLNPPGTALAYSTYLGGESTEGRFTANGPGSGSGGIAIDSQGNAYVSGHTASDNFPTKNSLPRGTGGKIIVTKLNPDGSDLIYSTFLGCLASCVGGPIAVDSQGNAYVTGGNSDGRFPTINAFPGTAAGDLDAIVAKLSADGARVLYATYLGGSGYDAGQGIALDVAGNAYVVGSTASSDFPTTTDAAQRAYGGDGPAWNGGGDAFLARISPGAEPPGPSPTINCPANIATDPDSGQTTAVVNFSVTANSTVVSCVEISCNPTSGAAFSFGSTPVNCIAKDALGGAAACSFTVTVINPSPLTIACPGAITRSTESGQCSATAAYAPTASGGSGSRAINCLPSSGSRFPKGNTTVVCSATDTAGNTATCSFNVTVNDSEKPQIACPANVTLACSVDALVPVSFSVTATDNCDSLPAVTSIPPSGSGFPVGSSTVTSTARDNSGNTATCTFTVTRAALGFTGFLSPIGGADASGGSFASPLRAFKLKSTIPVKFTSACSASAVLSGTHTLQVIKYSDATTAGDPIDASPQDAATTGDQFRITGGEWRFNLDTQATGMSVGIWQLVATLSDGSQHRAWIQIK